ncbi:hypothetical protein [Piscibacillus salipiscarius]
MKEVLKANRVVVLKDGEIYFDGEPLQLLKNETKLREVGLMAPYVTKLTKAFKEQGFRFDHEPLHIQDLVKQL